MDKVAVFPGSFDPFTLGHENVVKRSLPLFDKIIIAIGTNGEKPGFFSLEKRINWIKEIFKDELKIVVDNYTGLTTEYCKSINANFLLRGLRTAADFEYERIIAQTNKALYPEIETVFLLTTPELTAINSSIIRDVIKNGGDASIFVPKEINLKE